MKIGFSFMNTPQDPCPMELAVALEERGYESLWTGEHSHIPVSRETPWPAGEELPEPYKQLSDPYISLMAAAAVTTNLKIGTGIALLNQRDIFSQAKTISTLDRVSKGRVIVGAGIGWNREEFENSSRHPWKKRYTLLQETVAATRRLWQDEEAEYHGTMVNFDAVWSGAKPWQERPEGPPVMLGVMGPLGVQQAAAWSDGWMPADIGMANFSEQLASFRRQVSEHGRDPSAAPVSVQALHTPDLDGLKRYRDMGVERVIVGVDMQLWGKQAEIQALMDRYAEYIPKIA
ncbi:LLM class F420-dependent oxidoreductase [Halieaceae bacterium IMCC14734]|uniref:LLM class F420-dependent oxidoreductase n=1 Tax=Candidatus Litorirhabdus singularis TaxID=2518993 RepID=A0ABT3TE59_9GAMM|nr:LLM class F420-dependent oxidoreductase [Candidatus Litorirhabdus singularis]MCX2980475.1 LLM class F420-dependent oxidoreductase [Candidatus Litorirhabdus singularis]